MNFAQEIIALRTKNKLTQIAFAKRINVCPASVRGWESGQYKPSLKRLEAIDAVFESNLAQQALAEMPEKSRKHRQNAGTVIPIFTDDVEIFKSIITFLKLFMLLNPEGREKILRKITAYANDERYQIPRMRDAMSENSNNNNIQAEETPAWYNKKARDASITGFFVFHSNISVYIAKYYNLILLWKII